jgi:O-antigen ligase
MVTGEWPDFAIRATRPFLPARWLGWPWLYVVLVGLSMLVLASAGTVQPARGTRTSFLRVPVLVLTAAFLPAVIFSQVPSLSWLAFGCWLAIGAFILGAGQVIDDDSTLARTSTVLAAAALLLAARVIAWRFHEGLGTSAFHVRNTAWLGKLQIGWVLALVAPFLLARCVAERRMTARALHGAAWILSGAAIHLLASRTASIAFVVTTVLVCGLNRGAWRRWAWLLGIFLGMAIVLIAFSLTMSTHVLMSVLRFEQDTGIVMREGVWRETARMIADHPISGIGLGTYDDVAYSQYRTSADRHFFRNGWHAHNVFLHLLAETGVIGFLGWGVLWVTIVGFLGRTWRHGDASARLESSVALSAVLAFFILGVTEDLIAARVHASLRMSLTLGLLIAYGLRRSASGPATRDGVLSWRLGVLS